MTKKDFCFLFTYYHLLMFNKLTILFSLFLISCTTTKSLALPSAKVISIHDADTITVQGNNEKIKIRLACIDAPELSQSLGQQSTNYLKSLIKINDTITYHEADIDRYSRVVAEIYKGNLNLNLELIKKGQAFVYHRYLSSCQENENDYINAENQAKKNRIGLWNQRTICFPWDFRRHKCH